MCKEICDQCDKTFLLSVGSLTAVLLVDEITPLPGWILVCATCVELLYNYTTLIFASIEDARSAINNRPQGYTWHESSNMHQHRI